MAVGLVEASRLMWCPGLGQQSSIASKPFQAWLSEATYMPSVSGKNLLLSNIGVQQLLSFIAHDINRCASAASETLNNIRHLDNLPKSLGWPYVKLYYSSLFYVHVLLRLWGRFPIFLTTKELLPVREAVSAYAFSPPFKLETGQYLVHADTSSRTIKISVDPGAGGSHEAVWRELHKALSEFSSLISCSNYLKTDIVTIQDQIRKLSSLISNESRNLSWPSQMRNSIQYRQSEGVWYPYKGKNKTSQIESEISEITAGKRQVLDYLAPVSDDIIRLRHVCFALIVFARGVLVDMAAVAGQKSFLKFGQRKFEDQLPNRAI